MLSAADSEPLNDYFHGEFWPADEVNQIGQESSFGNKLRDCPLFETML